VDGATSYRVFIAADATALQAMTAPTATVATAFYDLPSILDFGRFYSWRVDAVRTSGVVAGKVQSFSIRFPQGAQLALAASLSGATPVSLAQGKLLLGSGSSSSGAQVFNFNAATGATSAIQSFATAGSYWDHYFGSSVAMDQDKLFVGAYARGNPTDDGGNVFAYRQVTNGGWEQSNILAPPSPVTFEGFGRGLATASNLMLAGTSSNQIGRVVAYITEPDVVQTQVFSASDGAVRDGFGTVIVMDGNRAIISASGSGASSNRIPCLYAFTRSTTTGQWTQSQKITIPSATTFSGAGSALALSGTTLAVRVSNTAVAIFTESGANQWTHSVSINSSAVTGTSSNFVTSIALHGDQLFIGDSGATYQGTSGGAVFSFRRNGSAWVQGPVITPNASRSDFGRGLACREGWLVVTGDTESRPASLFKIEQAPNRIPWFTQGAPSQLVAGRAFSIPVTAVDADGNAGLTITRLQGPSWLTFADQGLGAGLLSGTPVGAAGTAHDAQFEVRDAMGARSFWATRITLLASTDLPTLVQQPTGANLGIGQEFVLRAAASGIGPFKWQWYLDGNLIPGATRDRLVFGEVKNSDAGRYHVRVSNVVGEVASSEVVVAVQPANRNGGDWPTFGGSPSHTGRHPAVLDSTHFQPAWNATVQSGFALNRAVIANGRAVVVPQSRFAAGISVKGLALETGAAQWSFPVPSSNSTNPPTIHQDRVYFQRGKGLEGSDVPQLFCLNATNGSQIWVSPFGAQWESYEAPAVTDEGIYVNGGTYGGMYGYRMDGTERFFVSLAQQDRWTPTISDGRLVTCVGSRFAEHNPNDGSELWTISVNAGPAVAAIQGNSAVVIGTGITCVDLASRSVRWTVSGSARGTPAIADGRVFAIQGNAVRSYALADGSAGVVYQTTAPSNTNLVDQPILFNDRLVVSSETQTWIFNLQDGKLLQTLAAGGRLSYSNGYLLAAGNDGVLRAFFATLIPRLVVEHGSNSLAPAALVNFQTPLMGQNSSVELTLRNTGLGELRGLSAAFVAAGDYSVSTMPPTTLAPGASAKITVTLTPGAPGTSTATLQLASNDPIAAPFEIMLTGRSQSPPQFSGYSLGTAHQTAATISLQKLLAKASDPDGDAVSVSATGSTSAHGGTAVLHASTIRYTPPTGFSGTDTFAVSLRDSGGATINGTVTVTVSPAAAAGGQTLNPPKITPMAGGHMGLQFHGIPGRSYLIQRSTDLSTWGTLTTVTANSRGVISFTDENPPQPSAYYRLALP
jgi:hypothetical protein